VILLPRLFLCLGAIAALVGESVAQMPSGAAFDIEGKKTRKIDRIQYFPHAGKEVRFGGQVLRWTGEGNCDQKEGQKPIIEVQADGVSVRNAVIIESPDGIHVNAKDAVIENIVFPKVCEDAITSNGADRLVIRNCAFRGARDKAIQLNGGKDVLIENCYFENCAKPVRVKAGTTVTIRNCVAKGSVVFVLADGAGANVRVEGNFIEKSKWFVKAEKGAVIDIGANRLNRVQKPDEASDGGQILRR
jgi:hypothetical protein